MGIRAVEGTRLFFLVLILMLTALPMASGALFEVIGANQASKELGQSMAYALPAPGLTANGMLIDRALLISISPSSALSVAPRQLLSFSISYQIWQGADPYEKDQLMFISSWTPTWPPRQGFYFVIYDGFPSANSGVSGSAQFSLTAPDTPGTYYLLFVFAANYSYDAAASDFIMPPGLSPGHIEIDVADPSSTISTTSFPVQVTDAVSGVGISGVSIWLDGVFEESTNPNGSIWISAVYPAQHSFHIIAHGYEDASGTWQVYSKTDHFMIALNPLPPGLVPIYVYALSVGYLGQNPADSAANYLGALIMVNYVRNGQAQTTTQMTPFTLLADVGAEAEFSVVSYPHGWKFTCAWDNYGYRQHYTRTLSLAMAGGGRIAAYFSQIPQGTARIKNFSTWKGVFHEGSLIQFNALIENTGNFRAQFRYSLHVSLHTQTSNSWADVEIYNNTIFADALSVVNIAYVWQIPLNTLPGTCGAFLALRNTLGDQIDQTPESLFMIDTSQSYVEISGQSQIRLIHIHFSENDMNHLSPILVTSGGYFATSAEELLPLIESSHVFQSGDLQTLAEHLPDRIPVYYLQLDFAYENWLGDGSGGLTMIYQPSNGTLVFFDVPPVFLPKAENLHLTNSSNVLGAIVDQWPDLVQYVLQSTPLSSIAYLNISDLYSVLILKD